jgi:Holliday junction DNA helicase RuvB
VEDITADGNGPRVIEHFVGQPGVVAPLRVALEACRYGRGVLPHCLMVGPPGLGKTEMAVVLARETGTTLREAIGENLNTAGQAAGFLMAVGEGDVLFVDEVHGMGRGAKTMLLRALAERKLLLNAPCFGSAMPVVTLPRFTLLAATTDEFMLSKPLRDRFELVLRFTHYAATEIAEIIRRRTRVLHWAIDANVPGIIASRAKGVPRDGLRLLKAAERLARSEAASPITGSHVEQACLLEQVDFLGLDAVEQRYLALLADAGKPVRPNVLAASLDLPLQTVQHVTENFLLRAGLVERTDKGRALTTKGRAHVQGQKAGAL